jgi:signal transduction histidine kinase
LPEGPGGLGRLEEGSSVITPSLCGYGTGGTFSNTPAGDYFMAGEKIIIVDDEADVLDLCSRILNADGYQVKTARNGYQAIETAQQEDFDLLLTDIKMPGITGLEIAQTLKESTPDMIYVAMTGYSTIDMVIEALKLGIDEFITKPFTPKELSNVIAKALEKERLRKENIRLNSLIPLFELNKTLMGTVEVDKVFHRLLEISQQETKASLAILYTFEDGQSSSHICYQLNGEVNPQYQEACDRAAQLVMENGRQLVLNSNQSHSEQYQPLLKKLDYQAILATPLRSQKTDLGALVLVRKEQEFTNVDRDFVAVLCSQASIAMENARLFTEIQEAYKELKMLDHMKSEFINIAAHELRTPLAILTGYATVLESELVDDHKDYLTHIMRNAMRLRSLIDDMLNLQHLESGTATLSREELDLNEIVHDAIEDMGLIVTEKDLEMEILLPDDLPTIMADRQKVDLVVMNILHNAVKFTPEHGRVRIKARLEGEEVILSISDTGIGIPPDKLNRIFDRFYQVEPSLTREYGGIGLGLSIVKGVVELCGGTIHVESSEGEGSTFVITLPLDNLHLQRSGPLGLD